MPDEEYDFAPAEKLMKASEIIALANIFVRHGVRKIRLTGGEPLIRKDAADIMLALSKLPIELTMTTNGYRLNHYVETIRAAGIRSVNISLDTLDKDKFHLITRRNHFDRVMDNMRLMQETGVHVKINMVVMQGMNDDELLDFVALTREHPFDVRFIEFMPFSGNRWTGNQVMSLEAILDVVGARYNYVPLPLEKNGTSKSFRVLGHAGTFAIISTMSQPFCSTCNRMRLTADGKMKNCLFSSGETDLLTPLREGEDVWPIIRQNVLHKAEGLGGQFSTDFKTLNADDIKNRSMITIGG